MPETSPPPGRQHEDALIEHLGDIVAELRELGTALPSVNNPELHKRLEQLVALAPRMEEAHGTAPRQDIAEALMGLRDATRALHVPARDPELGATPTLRRVREGKGLIIAAIDDALAAAAVLGWQPIHPPALHEQPVMLSRETQEAEIEVLTLRLDKVEASLSTLDKARTEPTNFVQQVGLLNVYVPSMRVEVDLARLHLTIGEQTVDLGALARAVEAMGELTQGFTATVRGWMNDVSDSVKLGARAIRDAVSRLRTGVRTVVGMVLRERNDKESIMFPIPEMLLIPPGSFRMGIPMKESQREKTNDHAARPQHRVTIARPFWLGKYPVTRGEYAAFVEATGYDNDGGDWRNPRFPQTDRDPVVNVSHDDARAYVAWLSYRTHRSYRLPSEAEWEYAARAGTTTARYWGDGFGDASRYAHVQPGGTAPVGVREPNAFGLHDALGNVCEWVADPWHDNYDGAPSDGSVWTTGGSEGLFVLRGGAWGIDPRKIRAGVRGPGVRGYRDLDSGFRLARTSF